MPAIISGTVFNDLNRNATYVNTDPGIPGAYVVVQLPTSTCLPPVATDANGNYIFTGLTIPGTYTVYETVSVPNGCPPTNFTQPTGFNSSTTQRVISFTITQPQINANTNFQVYFGHVTNIPFGYSGTAIQISDNPSNLYTINLTTGVETYRGQLTPADLYNAIGFSSIDATIYGYDQITNNIISISQYTTVNELATVVGLPPQAYDCGDIDENGYLFLYYSITPDSRYYVVDVNPNRATYLKLVDPTSGFIEETSNYGTLIGVTTHINDWGFDPINNFLYGVDYTNGNVIQINPTTGATDILTTTGLPADPSGYGAVWLDSNANLYAISNSTGIVYKITISGMTATGGAYSQSNTSSFNDGARYNLAPVNNLNVVKSVNRTAAIPGTTITYTTTIKNISNFAATNVTFTDAAPAGTVLDPTSLSVNSVVIGGDPSGGINIGSLGPGGSAVISFDVVVGPTVPVINPIPNTSTVAYDQGTTITTNQVNTIIFDTTRGVEFI